MRVYCNGVPAFLLACLRGIVFCLRRYWVATAADGAVVGFVAVSPEWSDWWAVVSNEPAIPL